MYQHGMGNYYLARKAFREAHKWFTCSLDSAKRGYDGKENMQVRQSVEERLPLFLTMVLSLSLSPLVSFHMPLSQR